MSVLLAVFTFTCIKNFFNPINVYVNKANSGAKMFKTIKQDCEFSELNNLAS